MENNKQKPRETAGSGEVTGSLGRLESTLLTAHCFLQKIYQMMLNLGRKPNAEGAPKPRRGIFWAPWRTMNGKGLKDSIT